MNENTQRLEALLCVAGEAVSYAELKKLLGISQEELQQLVSELERELSGHGLAIVQTSHEVELVTSPSVSAWLTQTMSPPERDELTPAAAETLAVVAYLGPLTRYEVDMLRGVDSRRMLRQLIRRGAVARHAGHGRAPRYAITEEFLKRLGITRREELPRYGELSSREAIKQLLQSTV